MPLLNQINQLLIPQSKEELIEIIKTKIIKYGNNCNLNDIDVSQITDMSFLFSPKYELNNFYGDISNWDTSKVMTMERMFYRSSFNGDISKWVILDKVNMNEIFYESNFNESISNWYISKIYDNKNMILWSDLNNNIRKLFIINKNNKFSLMDENRNIIQLFKKNYYSDNIIQFSNDTYAIKINDYYGLYDSNSNLLLNIKCNSIEYIESKGYIYSVKCNNLPILKGYISLDGTEILKPQYSEIDVYNHPGPIQLACIKNRAKNIIEFYDNDNKKVLQKNLENEKITIDYKGMGLFLITKQINPYDYPEEYPFDYPFNKSKKYIEKYRNDHKLFTDKDYIIYIIDYNDNILSSYNYLKYEGKYPNLINLELISKNRFIGQTPNGFMLFSNNLKTLNSECYSTMKYKTDNIISVKQNKLYHFIDLNGNKLFNQEFKESSEFKHGLACVKELNGWQGYINTKGEKVFNTDILLIDGFINNYAIGKDLRHPNKHLIFNKEFNNIVEVTFIIDDFRQYNILHYSYEYDSMITNITNLKTNIVYEILGKIKILKQKYGLLVIPTQNQLDEADNDFEENFSDNINTPFIENDELEIDINRNNVELMDFEINFLLFDNKGRIIIFNEKNKL